MYNLQNMAMVTLFSRMPELAVTETRTNHVRKAAQLEQSNGIRIDGLQ